MFLSIFFFLAKIIMGLPINQYAGNFGQIVFNVPLFSYLVLPRQNSLHRKSEIRERHLRMVPKSVLQF